MSSSIHCQLWMGNLEPYMSETFIMTAFRKMGEKPTAIRLMRNKTTGERAAYCFVNFATDGQAIEAMHKLNGKPMPGTNPLVRFRLNSASSPFKMSGNTYQYSIWVGDLSGNVDDYQLYKLFASKYTSIKSAKVILDGSGCSKGYGFVHFSNEDEQKMALREMNGYVGLGSKPLKICNTLPKPKNENQISCAITVPTAYPPPGFANNSINNTANIAVATAAGGATGGAATNANTAANGTPNGGAMPYYDPSFYRQDFNNWEGQYYQANAAAAAANINMNNVYYQQMMGQSYGNPQMIGAYAAQLWNAQYGAQYNQHNPIAANSAINNHNLNNIPIAERN